MYLVLQLLLLCVSLRRFGGTHEEVGEGGKRKGEVTWRWRCPLICMYHTTAYVFYQARMFCRCTCVSYHLFIQHSQSCGDCWFFSHNVCMIRCETFVRTGYIIREYCCCCTIVPKVGSIEKIPASVTYIPSLQGCTKLSLVPSANVSAS